MGHPEQKELTINLQVPGPPLDEDAAEFIARQLAKGSMHAGGLGVDDCPKTYAELTARGSSS